MLPASFLETWGTTERFLGGIMKKYVLAIFLAVMFPGAAWGEIPPSVPRESIALVFSSTVHGELEPCG